MERQYRISIVRAAWLILIGVAIAFLVPLVSGIWMVESMPRLNDENFGEFAAGISAVNQIQFWSVLAGFGVALVGAFWIAVVVSRWFAGRPETLASNGQSS